MRRRSVHTWLVLLFIFLFPVAITTCGGGGGGNNTLNSVISGRITTPNGAGLSGVSVYLDGVYAGCPGEAARVTDANGYYSFTTDFLFSGSGTITPVLSGYTFTPSSRSLEIESGQSASGQDFIAAPVPYSISGTVRTSSGIGIAGIPITLSGAASATTITDTNGGYMFAGLLKGSYTLVPSQSGPGYAFTPLDRTVNIVNTDVTGQDFTVTTYVLSGRVTNNSGIGFSGVSITLSGTESLSTTTDANGYYTFAVFQTGAYTITPSMSVPGYTFTPAQKTVSVTSGDVTGQNFSTVAYVVSGRVTTPSGAGVSGITMSVTGQSSFSSTSDANGDYAVAVIQSGVYTIKPSATCNSYSFTPADITVSVIAADVTGQNFAANPIPHTLSGRITAPDGSAAPGVIVNLSGNASATTTTDANGDYTFDIVQSGYFTITPSTSEYTFHPAYRIVSICGTNVTGQDFAESVTWGNLYGPGSFYSIRSTSDNGYVSAGAAYGQLQLFKLSANGTIFWQRAYGEGEAHAIQETAGGGYIVAGITLTLGTGGSALRVLKLDANGFVLWQKVYSSTYGNRGNYIFQTADGGYVVAGSYESSAGIYDLWVLRLDTNGNIVWQKSYGNGWANSIQQTSDGGYIAAGSHIIKLDVDGNRVWQKSYEGLSNSIRQTPDGGYIAAGYTSSFGAGNNDFWVSKLAADGSVVWQKAYGETYSEIANSVLVTSDGGYSVAGYMMLNSGDEFIRVLKLDQNGNITWQKKYGGWPERLEAYSSDITSDGRYILAGTSSYFGTFGLVLKIDSNGDGCKIYSSSAVVAATSALPTESSNTEVDTTAVATATSELPKNTLATASLECL